MRLRQLGTTQSITFFAPPEVHQSIIDLRKKKLSDPLYSYDVVCWLLEQTCHGIEQLQPLYFSQGADFCRRAQAALDYPEFAANSQQREAYLASLRQIEQQTLEQLYGHNTKPKPSTSLGKLSPRIAVFMKELNTRRKGFQDTGNAVHGSALQEVEQEREVAYEGSSCFLSIILLVKSRANQAFLQWKLSAKCRSQFIIRRSHSLVCIGALSALPRPEELQPIQLLTSRLSQP